MDRAWSYLNSAPASATFDASALPWADLRFGDLIRTACANDQLIRLRRSWSRAELALVAYYPTASLGSCLAAEPLLWIDLQEPQVTRGLVHFVNAGPREIRIARTWALLHALWRLRSPERDEFPVPLDHVRDTHVVAEASAARSRRIDLVAWIDTHEGHRFGAVVEAKFAHHLTRAQLDTYERAAVQPPYSLAPERTVFAVMGSSFSKPTARELREHPIWCFVSWYRLLIAFETALATAECDDQHFAEFRRTVWHRASR